MLYANENKRTYDLTGGVHLFKATNPVPVRNTEERRQIDAELANFIGV